jgi:serine/threonine protein kinase
MAGPGTQFGYKISPEDLEMTTTQPEQLQMRRLFDENQKDSADILMGSPLSDCGNQSVHALGDDDLGFADSSFPIRTRLFDASPKPSDRRLWQPKTGNLMEMPRSPQASAMPPPTPAKCDMPASVSKPRFGRGFGRGRLQRQNTLQDTKNLITILPTPSPPYPQVPSPSPSPASGMLSEFAVLEQIGSGAFSEVFKVRSHANGKLYAVKRAKRAFRSKRDRSLLMREVQMFQRLINPSVEGEGHAQAPPGPRPRLRRRCDSVEEVSPDFEGYSAPHVVQYFRAWQEDGFFYTQAELCEGGSLEQLLLSFGPGHMSVPIELVWSFVGDIASGLDFIHSKHIVHLDIKPANVFIGHKGSLKIGDFGEAVPTGCDDDGLEGDNTYMAKELLAGSPALPACDVFSFGLLVYEMVSGRTLPDGGEQWQALRNGEINPPLPMLPSLAEHLKQQADGGNMLQHGTQHGNGWGDVETVEDKRYREQRARAQQQLLQQLVLAMIRPVPTERPLAGQIYMHQAVQCLRDEQAAGAKSPRAVNRVMGGRGQGAGGGGGMFEEGFGGESPRHQAAQRQQQQLQQQQQQLVRNYASTQGEGLLSIAETRSFVLLKCEERWQQQQKRQHYQKHLRSSWEESKGGSDGFVGRRLSRDGVDLTARSSYDAEADPPSRPERPVRPTLFLVPPEFMEEEGMQGMSDHGEGMVDVGEDSMMCTPRNDHGRFGSTGQVQRLDWDQ